MDIIFYKPRVTTGNIKCTIHKNGKLGFSRQAINKFNLETKGFAKIGFDADNKNDNDLYLIIQDFNDEETFKINKAGEYYYINTKYLFDDLKIDYLRKKIIYDIQETKSEGKSIYKLVRRDLDRKRSRT